MCSPRLQRILQYRGWHRGMPDPPSIKAKRASVRAALDAGVTICSGSDVGVFAHGDNARELELLVDYGMKPAQALRSATSVAAKALHLDNRLGSVKRVLGRAWRELAFGAEGPAVGQTDDDPAAEAAVGMADWPTRVGPDVDPPQELLGRLTRHRRIGKLRQARRSI